jgi:hypothetical protein
MLVVLLEAAVDLACCCRRCPGLRVAWAYVRGTLGSGAGEEVARDTLGSGVAVLGAGDLCGGTDCLACWAKIVVSWRSAGSCAVPSGASGEAGAG